MKWFSRKTMGVSYGGMAFVMFVVAICAIAILWMLVLLFSPRLATVTTPNLRVARRLAVPTLYSDVPVTRSSVPVVTILCEISAYTPSVQECDATPLITASGKRVYVGGVASDWSVLPCGSIVIIPNYNNGDPCTIVDTGGAIKGNKLDVFMWETDAAVHWGRRRNVKVQVLYVPKAKT